MSDFGANLLELAFSVIPSSTASWEHYIGQTQTDSFATIDAYNEPVDVSCSIQRVRQDSYKELGLAMGKKYKIVYISENMGCVNDIQNPDLLTFDGRKWVVIGDVGDWFSYDGWRSILVVAQSDYGE